MRIADSRIQVGVPESRGLTATENLHAHLVIIKGFMEPDEFLEAARRQTNALEVDPNKLCLIDQPHVVHMNRHRDGGTRSPYLRRTVRVRGKEIVGFALNATGLTAEESIALQTYGIGGRRRFGCGIFVACKESVQ